LVAVSNILVVALAGHAHAVSSWPCGSLPVSLDKNITSNKINESLNMSNKQYMKKYIAKFTLFMQIHNVQIFSEEAHHLHEVFKEYYRHITRGV